MITTEDSALFIQALFAIPFLLMGVSHIVQPKMWVEFFSYLHSLGFSGVLIRTFALELVPAFALITFHLVWSGPEVILTIYGLLLALKVSLSLLFPALGLRSLAAANQVGDKSIKIAGLALLVLSAICFWCVFD